MKLTVRIKDPGVGRGWYTVYLNLPDVDTLADETLVGAAKGQNPDATAVQVVREYPA